MSALDLSVLPKPVPGAPVLSPSSNTVNITTYPKVTVSN